MKKTSKSAVKRIIRTGKNKLRRRNLSAQHLATNKSLRSRRKSTKTSSLSNADKKRLIKYL